MSDNLADAHSFPLAQRWAEAIAAHDVPRYIECFDEDILLEDVPVSATMRGREQLAGFVTALFDAIPDYKVHVTSAFSSGNMASVEYLQTGTVVKEIAGIPGTGKSFQVRAVSVFELKNGKIKREAAYFDLQTLLKQLTPT